MKIKIRQGRHKNRRWRYLDAKIKGGRVNVDDDEITADLDLGCHRWIAVSISRWKERKSWVVSVNRFCTSQKIITENPRVESGVYHKTFRVRG